MKRAKLFRVNPMIAREFEIACKLLGVKESQIIEGLMSEWLDRIKDQLTLDHLWAKISQM